MTLGVHCSSACALRLCACIHVVYVMRQTWHRSLVLHSGSNKMTLVAHLFLWKDNIWNISVTVNPAQILFCDLSKHRSAQSLIVKKWKWLIISSPHCAQTCYIWHSVFIGTSSCSAVSFTLSSRLPFLFPPPPTSLLPIFPTPFPLLPSFLPLFAFAPLIHFRCQLLPFFVKLLFPHFPLLCLLDCRGGNREERKEEAR